MTRRSTVFDKKRADNQLSRAFGLLLLGFSIVAVLGGAVAAMCALAWLLLKLSGWS